MTFHHKDSHSNPYLHSHFPNKGWLKLNNFLIPKTPWCIRLQTVGHLTKWILCSTWRSHRRSPSKSSPIKQGRYFKFWKRNVAFTCISLSLSLSLYIYIYISFFSIMIHLFKGNQMAFLFSFNQKKHTHTHAQIFIHHIEFCTRKKKKKKTRTKQNKARMQDSWPQLKSCLVMKKISFVLLGVFHFLLHQLPYVICLIFFLLYFGYFV